MDYAYRDILKEPLGPEEIEDLASLGEMEVRDLINRRSTVFKKMGVDPETMTSARAGELILENPRVMHRPLLTDGSSLVVGFKPEEMAKLL